MEATKNRNISDSNKSAHEQLCSQIDAIDWGAHPYYGCKGQVARALGYPKSSALQRVHNDVHRDRRTHVMILLLAAARMAEQQDAALRAQARSLEVVA